MSAHYVFYDGETVDYEYRYNDYGATVFYCYSSSNGDGCTIEYEYDQDKRLIRENQKDSSYITNTSYYYDENGNLCHKLTDRHDDYFSYTETWDYTYDGDGNRISMVHLSNGLMESTHEYRYENGKIIQLKYITANFWWNIEYTYDKNGNLIKENYYDSHEISEITKYTYDKNGNLIKVVCDDEISTFEYEVVYFPNGIPEQTLECLLDNILDY